MENPKIPPQLICSPGPHKLITPNEHLIEYEPLVPTHNNYEKHDYNITLKIPRVARVISLLLIKTENIHKISNFQLYTVYCIHISNFQFYLY